MEKEFDVSDIAWEIFELMYEDNLPTGFKNIGKNRRRITEKFTYNTIVSPKINFRGDTDFNFTKGFAHSRLECYRKLIKKSENPKGKVNSDKLV